MDLHEYERHRIGRLCWHCHEATRPSPVRQRRCPAWRRKWSYEQRRIRWELLKAFCLATTAHHAARPLGCSYPTAYRAFTDCRKAMARLTAEEKRPLLGEWELDESYFGGKREGKRGRGAAGKVAVFGVLERDSKVYTVAVPRLPQGDADGQDQGVHRQGKRLLHRRVRQLQRPEPLRQARADRPPGGVRRRRGAHQWHRGVWERRQAAAPTLPQGGP